MNQPDHAWDIEELKREIEIGVEQADRGEFVEFTAQDIIREGREILEKTNAREGRG
jgi:hypothetical protein